MDFVIANESEDEEPEAVSNFVAGTYRDEERKDRAPRRGRPRGAPNKPKEEAKDSDKTEVKYLNLATAIQNLIKV